MLVGYARVSTAEQSLARRPDALAAAGCGRTFSDVAPTARPSGAVGERVGLAAALAYVRAGDTLVVWRLDRLGRTLRHRMAQVTALDARGVGCRSLTEAMDTTTTSGELVFHIFGALAEFERDLIRERTRARLAAARARGRMGGRPRALSDSQVEMARVLLADPPRPVDEGCAALHVSRATLYRYVPAGNRPPRAAPPERPGRLRRPPVC